MKMHYGWNELKDVDFMNWLPLILPLVFIELILVVVALVDLYRNRKTRNNVLVWSLIIIFVNTFGPILYFVLGRKDRKRS